LQLDHLWLTDFRNYASADLTFAPSGVTVIHGANGEGKTNLLEAVGWVATLSSFRGAPDSALVRFGFDTAVVRASGVREGRELLIEGTIAAQGRNRVLVNRQPLRRTRDLLGALRVTVFAPSDLGLLQGGPAERRRYLDELLVACHPRWDALIGEVDRILRQRGVLLKQAAGRLTPSIETTLDVWDEKLASAGSSLASARAELLARLQPLVSSAYERIAARADAVSLSYVAPWMSGGLGPALEAARRDDVRRGVSTVGPHRDELAVTLNDLPARTHASQGEQRSLALALRLGGHQVVAEEAGEEPVLLLDDVFSELDPVRSAALVSSLPSGQALLTTAGPPPAGITPALVLAVEGGAITARGQGPPVDP
jgi:DNA replication and repair protein RecF